MYYSMLDYFVKKYESQGLEYAFQAQTIEEFEIWKQALRARLCEITGLNRCEKSAGGHEMHGIREVAGFSAEYHVLETEPGVWMPFYLLRPANIQKNAPVLLLPHGHGGGKEEMIAWEKDFIQKALALGFLIACPDERGSGERREFVEQGETEELRRATSHRELLQVGICFGRSMTGMAVWDLMRLADFMQSLPEAGDFLACAGMSGGGQQTLWFSALDERVSAAITSGYFYGVKESLIELPHNCACNFVPHFFETADMGELGAMLAPRPFFIESGKKDPLSGKSGIANVLSQVETTKRAYRLFDAEEKVVHSIHEGGHEWIAAGMDVFLKQALEMANRQ